MLGVCYYPEHWPEDWWDEDARQMRERGIRLVRIAEFAWSRIEPEPGRFEWGWLDRAISTLARNGLKIVMCTPTAAPPKWLIDRDPLILPVDADGQVRGFGSRRHTSFSSPVWRAESRRITEAVARRYGTHEAVIAWQIDNEFGCHDTVLSYGPDALAGFRTWLASRYGTISALNEAWGNVFWSMEARSFDEVALPVGAVTETNPAARLDFRRYASEQVLSYAAMQIEIIRAHSPERPITHNMMGRFTEFDHWQMGRLLDFASWDSYPLGFTDQFDCIDEERRLFSETGHPDIAAFHHDLYRGIGNGRFWVMEQQPGPVNWAPWNPVPKKGMVRLWSWEAFAHGAEAVNYFRWRQVPFGQEQMHAGLNRPDRVISPGGAEAAEVGRELQSLGRLPDSRRAHVALVFDYEAAWITALQPHGSDFRYLELCVRWYEAARRWGVDVDIVPQDADLSAYTVILVPTLPHVTDNGVASFSAASGRLLFGPRTGSKGRNFAVPPELPPGPLRGLLGLCVSQVASLRPELSCGIVGSPGGTIHRWREWIETEGEILSRFEDGMPAIVRHGNATYLAGIADADLLLRMMGLVIGDLGGVRSTPLPVSVRLRRRGDLVFVFNYGTVEWDCQVAAGEWLIGGPRVPPQGVCCWRELG